MEDYYLKYEKLKSEYENYQAFVELEIQKLSNKNMKLEKDMNALANIVEISKYINSFLSDENLIAMINDMVLGLLGVAHSTIYLEENGSLVVKATNMNVENMELTEDENYYIKEGKSYLINSKDPVRFYDKYSLEIRSAMGMPIKIRDKYTGFILVEHHLYNFLDLEHEKFLRAIANQIAIAIENSMLYREIQETAKMDPLLGIYNRRYFFKAIEENARNNQDKPYAIVMVDLDGFKKFNDNYGHQFGDEVLIKTTEVIKNMLEPDDILARYGGEELIIYISKVDSVRSVYDKIEAIRVCIEKNIIVKDNISKSITASFGIGYFPEDGKTINEVIKTADKFLYRSKALGKNMVLISDFVV
ncbi:GGDEF domain-containing protein [Clostridium paraputrificum]|uniref:GGDEF domain-containing protein n=1 Tax=Clostridium paraputrificum TaxID=29363 RepID=UPI003D32573B